MENDTSDQWWSGGFPEIEKATENQRYYLQKRMHLVESMLSLEEKTALRMRGGFKEWLDLVSKDRAREIIGRVKSLEDANKMQEVANSIARAHGFEASSDGICSMCGGKVTQDGVVKRCEKCGEASLHVQL